MKFIIALGCASLALWTIGTWLVQGATEKRKSPVGEDRG